MRKVITAHPAMSSTVPFTSRAPHCSTAAVSARACRVSPASAARLAARIGTPAGAIGTSTRAMSPPVAATIRERRSWSSLMSSPAKNAG